jgi:hypothetical protein
MLTNKPFMQSVVILNVIMQSVVASLDSGLKYKTFTIVTVAVL